MVSIVQISYCVDTSGNGTFPPLWPSRPGLSHSGGDHRTGVVHDALTSDIAAFVATVDPRAVPNA